MNTSDWNNFGSYFNGLMAPLLMFMNILVLMNINNEVSKIGKMNSAHRNKLYIIMKIWLKILKFKLILMQLQRIIYLRFNLSW